ncbi:hypothetical protein MNBD_BACTEROID05-162 [hydrothermal vent metagenome]|uniref:Protein translocase membrane subunit SecG n=1 Tax=hydrothermal vent metagenome TaxID=652676 RepID=A0A3B0UHQ2_9ZZZZ
MLGFIVVIHAIVCVFLIVIILMQSGRGGGLTESFSSAESMFGAQTNSLMTKATTVVCIMFFITCLSLAFLSSKKDESLMSNKVAVEKTQNSADEVAGMIDEAVNESSKAVKKVVDALPDVPLATP